MTDEQIMQGLKWCYQVEGSCGDCPYRPDDIKKAKCHDRLGNDVLGLIKRQQAEIERLTAEQSTGINELLVIVEDEIRAEAIKEFADNLKAIGAKEGAYDYVSVFEIDNLVKKWQATAIK